MLRMTFLERLPRLRLAMTRQSTERDFAGNSAEGYDYVGVGCGGIMMNDGKGGDAL